MYASMEPMVIVCPSNPAPPPGTVQWTGSPAAWDWAWTALQNANAPLFTAVYCIIDGMHVTAREEYQMRGGECVRGITLYRPIDVAATAAAHVLVAPAAAPTSDGMSMIQLAGFAFVAFSTAFGLTWAAIRGEQH